jgi:hypothetical protein
MYSGEVMQKGGGGWKYNIFPTLNHPNVTPKKIVENFAHKTQ